MTLPYNVRYIALDTETTGVNNDDKAVELGWIELDESFNVIEQHETLLDPQRPIASNASAVHGLVYDDVKDSPTIEEYFSADDPSCYGKKIEDPVVLIGHRIAFDHGFVKPYITNVVQELCTLRWARRLYPDAPDHKLQTLIFELGLPRATDAHRVMSDIWTAIHLCKHICERTNMTLRELAIASAQPMEVHRMSFGKHKGSSFREIPTPYLRWMQETLSLDEDMAYTISKVIQERKQK